MKRLGRQATSRALRPKKPSRRSDCGSLVQAAWKQFEELDLNRAVVRKPVVIHLPRQKTVVGDDQQHLAHCQHDSI